MQCYAEKLNQTVGKVLWQSQVENELNDKKQHTEWIDKYQQIYDIINKERLAHPPKHHKIDDKHTKIDKEPIIEPGTQVRLALIEPEDTFGNKQQGTFRKTDIRWRVTPTYEVVDYVMTDGQPTMFKIRNKENHRIFKHLVPLERLQIV